MQSFTGCWLTTLLLVPLSCLSQGGPAQNLAAARDRLQALSGSTPEQLRVSRDAQEGLAAFKLALGVATDSFVESESSGTPPGEVARRLVSALSPADTSAASSMKLSIEAIATAPDGLTVSKTFPTVCGDDSLLLMYRRSGERWKKFANQSGIEVGKTLGKAFGMSAVSWSHSDASVVVAHTPSNCGEVSHTILLSAYSTKDGKAERGELWTIPIAVRTVSAAEFHVEPEGFTLRARLESLDHPDTGSERTLSYRVEKDGGHRVLSQDAPPADLFTEWVNMPWSDARRYALRETARPLEGLHWRLNKSDKLAPQLQAYTLQEIRTCTDTPTHREIKLDLRPNDPKTQESAYVEVDTTFSDSPFRFASAVADPSCADGRVLLEQRQ